MFNNIPEELKIIPQWVLWREEYPNNDTTKPLSKTPYCAHNSYFASVSNPATWATFQQCLTVLPKTNMSGIGLVITPELNLTCIDIDDPYKLKPDGTPKFDNPEELLERQKNIVKTFNSYQEISPSGKGLHIWIKGSVPTGRDKCSIGLYPNSRFMTFTGNVYNNAPIREYNGLLYQLWAELGDPKNPKDLSEEEPERQSDSEIFDAASNASNSELFFDLWEGNWQRHYPSQSEADYALINILGFYSRNGTQIRRMFRASALGVRKKAQRDKYIDDMVGKSFDNKPPEVDITSLKENLSKAFLERIKPKEITELPTSETAMELENLSAEIYTPPRGLIGELAAFIYNAAPRPVPEIALAAAIGLMSGICGRCYNISGTGLNQYTVLLAETGRGKEAMANGISKLIASILPAVPQASIFYGPSKIQSQEALLKHISKTSKSFVSLMGEFSETLEKMSNRSRNPSQQGVKQSMLDLYTKSGKGQILSNMIYSNAEKNTDVLTAPAFSILAETVPSKFYELMTEEMIAEGFLSRFVIIEYLGIRHPLNKNHQFAEVPERLKEQLGQLCAYALQLNNSDNVIEITTTTEAQSLLDKFDKLCDRNINNGNIAAQELWNRAHLISLRLSGLLAIGTNYINPQVSVEQATWAINLVGHNIRKLLGKFDSGEVGAPQNQNKQLNDLKNAFLTYLSEPWEKVKSYPGTSINTHNHMVVPHAFLTAFCRMRASFKQDRIGPVQALKTLLISLIESGDIQEISVPQKKEYGIGLNGKCYVVTNKDSFL